MMVFLSPFYEFQDLDLIERHYMCQTQACSLSVLFAAESKQGDLVVSLHFWPILPPLL